MKYGSGMLKRSFLIKTYKTALCLFYFLFSVVTAFSQVKFFAAINPSLYWTSYALYSTVDDTLLGPEDYARYYSFPSLINFGLEMRQSGAELVFRVDIRPDFLSFLTEPYISNLPWLDRPLIAAIGDVNMPTVGYMDYHGTNIELSAGRRKLHWGPARYGLAISDTAPYLDHLWFSYQFNMPHSVWWYNFVAISSDRAGQSWSNLDQSRFGYKTIFAHRAGYQNDRIRIAIGELNLVHDIAPNLVDMSPVAAFHNLYEDSYSNVMLDASIEARLGSFRGYSEFVMDDLVMNWESWQGRPTALGWNFGLEWNLVVGLPYKAPRMSERDYMLSESTFKQSGGFSLGFEHYRTTTYLYNRENISGKWTLTDHRLVNSNVGYIDSGEAFFLGFAYGPDVALDMACMRWESEKLKAEMTFALFQQGSYTIKSPYPPADGAATWFSLKEPVARQIRLSLNGEYVLCSSVQLWGQSEIRFGDNPEMKLSAGVTINLGI